jgi:hypothetical protein
MPGQSIIIREFAIVRPACSFYEHAPDAFLTLGIARRDPKGGGVGVGQEKYSDYFNQIGPLSLDFRECDGGGRHMPGMVKRLYARCKAANDERHGKYHRWLGHRFLVWLGHGVSSCVSG